MEAAAEAEEAEEVEEKAAEAEVEQTVLPRITITKRTTRTKEMYRRKNDGERNLFM